METLSERPLDANSVAVIGAGAFGTALAVAALQAGGPTPRRVILLSRRESQVEDFKASGRNEDALPGIALPEGLIVTAEPDAIEQAGTVLLAVPSQAQGDMARALLPVIARRADVVVCAKGLERETGRLLTEVVGEQLHRDDIAVLSGPGFAADIARGLPTAMTLAAASAEQAHAIATRLSGPTFRLYASTDRVGVQLGGALKNVLAIACGIIEGAGLGESARAAMISRGLAEMSRLVTARGGVADTVRGLSGLGDLVLTGTSHQSRNLRYGIALGRGGAAREAAGRELVEGALAASVAAQDAAARGVEMPITQAVAAIIDGGFDIRAAVDALMSRPITQE
ncbi:NAD(P)H-dependent glycerol-3-phosphate dehydrogenase [Rhizobium rhizosphaerae]|uniref:NAD(P)H-dependent glycerol-3-phosphate dehydrogenase n=1 Tax=Xaviernesmea rhizosphaerae TaxID=1672749 RepID=UPI000B32E84C|nr:NAD(P)H-dependent glycerol-3-phosphate dehydrogenase [Xaviernesmea rhizosphaerae]